ncbi:hypothetical protein [Natronospira bacteriovora]|uniref:Uncharacterized protein n=1 Tax=Natronospira bacteriovora TaxID=3069753 RepID=A0ABU0W5E0_9GAMM|nr:hypothetical protein [Natronospira sp. AB-CW4]MDQ2069229.1 hypothetical protein [Natronospira sp. AB-CW4]
MIGLLSDILSILASWAGMGVLLLLAVGLKIWQIMREYRRRRR